MSGGAMRLSTWEILGAQRGVLTALMLRDVKTRFGGSAWGFLLSVGWPLTHSMILLAINTAIGRTIPYGESGLLWFATGTTPYVVFLYIARWTMLGIVQNKPLMAFPLIKVTDILFARVIVEILSAGLVIVLTCVVVGVLGTDFIPSDIPAAFEAIGAAMLLGAGFGILNAVLAGLFPMWVTGFALFQIILWLLSGVLALPDALPEIVRYYMSFNPLLQVVEWTRSAYYPSYTGTFMDHGYAIGWGIGLVFSGLLLERLIRGRFSL